MKEIFIDKSDNSTPPILDQITTLIERKESEVAPNHVHFIAVCGVSASGKSHLVQRLGEILEESNVINVDAFLDPYRIDMRDKNHFAYTSMRVEGEMVEGIDPRLWDFPVLIDSILRLVDGEAVTIPVYDPVAKVPSHTRVLSPVRRLVLEGAHSFVVPGIQEMINTRILVRASLHDRLMRKLIRSSRVNLRENMSEPIKRYLLNSEPAWRAHQEVFEPMADLLIDNPANPEVDYFRFNSLPSTEEISYVLRPTEETGKVHEGEFLGLASSKKPEEATLVYGVEDKILVNCSISLDTLDLLLNHYEIYR